MNNSTKFVTDENLIEPECKLDSEKTIGHETESNKPKITYSTLINKLNDGETEKSNIDNDDGDAKEFILDTELLQLLSSWGFSDLYDHFRNLKLNVDILKYIDNEDLKEVFGDKPLGKRVEFKHKLNKWRKENGIQIGFVLSADTLNNIKILVEEQVRKRLAEHSCSELHSGEYSESSMPSSPSSNASYTSNPSSPNLSL